MTLVVHQLRYDLLVFWRNGQARFFTVLMPLIFLVIFAAVFGSGTVEVAGSGAIKRTQYYVPGLAAMGVISASFVNLAITITTQRDSGILKRRRATPVPAWALIGGRALSCVAIALATVAALVLVGVVFYGVSLSVVRVLALIVVVAVAALSFCCLGFALAAVIRSAESAVPLVQAIVLPLYFISGVFIPTDQIPRGLLAVADVFPVRHLAAALVALFTPTATFAAGQLALVAAWGCAGLLVALRLFRWVPSR